MIFLQKELSKYVLHFLHYGTLIMNTSGEIKCKLIELLLMCGWGWKLKPL